MAQLFTSKDGTKVIVSVFPANKGLASGIISPFNPPETTISEENLIHTIEGSRRTRPPFLTYGQNGPLGGTKGVRWLFDSWRTIGTARDHDIVLFTNNNLWADSADGNFAFKAAIPSDTPFVTGDALIGLTVFGVKGKGVYSYDHTNPPALIADAPSGGWIVRKHRRSIYVAGMPDQPERIEKCDTEDPTNFSTGSAAAYFIDSGASDVVGITALFPEIQGRLYVGKYNSLYEMDTSVASAPLRPLSDTLGVLSHSCVAALGKSDAIFASSRGLHSLAATAQYGDIGETFLSRPVNDIWQNRMDFTRPEEFVATYSTAYGCYILVYPDRSSGHYNLLGYHPTRDSFFHWEGADFTYVTQAFLPPDFRLYTLLGTINGEVVVLGMPENRSFLDRGTTSYSSSFTTPPIFPASVPGPVFVFERLEVYFLPGGVNDITVTYQIDNQTPQTRTMKQSSVSSSGAMAKLGIPLSGYGESISFTFSVSGDGSTVSAGQEILGYNITAKPAADRDQVLQLGA